MGKEHQILQTIKDNEVVNSKRHDDLKALILKSKAAIKSAGITDNPSPNDPMPSEEIIQVLKVTPWLKVLLIWLPVLNSVLLLVLGILFLLHII
jgi:hypothetical protein